MLVNHLDEQYKDRCISDRRGEIHTCLGNRYHLGRTGSKSTGKERVRLDEVFFYTRRSTIGSAHCRYQQAVMVFT